MKLLPPMRYVGILLVGICAGFFAAHRPAPPLRAKLDDDAIAARILPDVNLDVTTRGEIVQYIHGIYPQMTVDWPVLANDQLYPGADTRLHVQLHHPTLAQLLEIISCQTGLVFYIDNGILTVREQRRVWDHEPDHFTLTRTYDVGDLLHADGPWSRLAAASAKGRFYGAPGTRERRREELLGLIQTVVDHDSWFSGGIGVSHAGEARIYHGCLIVTQVQSNLEAIEEILRILRSAK